MLRHLHGKEIRLTDLRERPGRRAGAFSIDSCAVSDYSAPHSRIAWLVNNYFLITYGVKIWLLCSNG